MTLFGQLSVRPRSPAGLSVFRVSGRDSSPLHGGRLLARRALSSPVPLHSLVTQLEHRQ
jgi:hypothetical protein